MTALDILIRTRELLATPESWTQGAYARTFDGTPLYSNGRTDDPTITCRCLSGALLTASGCERFISVVSLAFLHAGELFALPATTTRAAWNDHPMRQHSEVLALLDRAIVRAEAEAS